MAVSPAEAARSIGSAAPDPSEAPDRPIPADDHATEIEPGSGLPRYFAVSVSVAATLWIAQEAAPVLQPLALAILVWFLIGAVARSIARLVHGRGTEPGTFSTVTAAFLFAAILAGTATFLIRGSRELRDNLPQYADTLNWLYIRWAWSTGLDDPPTLSSIVENADAAGMLLQLFGAIASSAGLIFIVFVFLAFLFAESAHFQRKFHAITGKGEHRRQMRALLIEIRAKVETYLAMKCLIGLVQAVPTLVVLWLVGVDSPFVWAVLVFLFSFIPTVGSLVGAALPALMALVQFSGLEPFLIVALTLTPLQVIASNWLEPRLLGSSLNLSALAVLLAIFLGGLVWGVVGALVSVPMLNIAAIACAHFERTRHLAVLVSRDGRIAEPGR